MSTKQKEARVKLRKKFQWYCNDARTHADEMAAQFNCDDPLHPYGPQEFTSPGHLPAHDHHPRHRHGDAMSRWEENVVFIDTETTGLDPDVHEIWEVAAIWWDGGWIEKTWQLPVDLSRADPYSLNVGKFHERRAGHLDLIPPGWFASSFAEITWGKHLVGAVPSFDEERLRKLLRANGQCPGWHYHLIDVEGLAYGYLCGLQDSGINGFDLPWNSSGLSQLVGVDPYDFEKHTALGDARWAKAIYEKVMAAG